MNKRIFGFNPWELATGQFRTYVPPALQGVQATPQEGVEEDVPEEEDTTEDIPEEEDTTEGDGEEEE